jgi:hypothetical protein
MRIICHACKKYTVSFHHKYICNPPIPAVPVRTYPVVMAEKNRISNEGEALQEDSQAA